MSVLWFNFVSAQQFYKVWDANEQTFITQPDQFTDLGSRLFMFSSSVQIYSTDGSDTGTYLLNKGAQSQIHPWQPPVESERLGSKNGLVCFPSYDSLQQACLAVSDGTPEGTQNIAITNPDGFNAELYAIIVCDDKFWFYASSSADYLWVSDGTPNGTYPTLDLSYGAVDAVTPGCYDGEVAYTYSNITNGVQAWLADSAGTSGTMISDVSMGLYPTAYFTFNGKLYFNGVEGPSTIYQSDGTLSGTEPLLSSTGDAIPMGAAQGDRIKNSSFPIN